MAKKEKRKPVVLWPETYKLIMDYRARDPMRPQIQAIVNAAVQKFLKELNTHDLEKA